MAYKSSSSSVLNVFVIILLVWFIDQGSSQLCNANYEHGEEYRAGRCVTFPECPVLFNILRSSSITSKELNLLQRLTCLKDNENPTICCALKNIKELANYEGIKPPPSKSPITTAGDLINYPSANGEKDKIDDRIKFIPTTSSIKHKNLALLPSLEECGISSATQSSDRIIGGVNSEHAEFPWLARIGYRSLETGEIEFYCGATVISRKYVITAAHCTQEIDLADYKPVVIRLGEHDADKELDCSAQLNCSRAVDLKIDKVIPHPGYNVTDKSNDIELIRVHGNIPFDTPFVKPICLPFEEEYNIKIVVSTSTKGIVTGWGRTKWNRAEGSSILQKVSLPIVNNEECQANYSSKINISELQMCAGGLKQKDSCGGDSGGPIAITIPMKTVKNHNVIRPSIPKLIPKFFQLGVVSFGPVQCGVGGLPGVYTRVSAYLPWLLDNLEP